MADIVDLEGVVIAESCAMWGLDHIYAANDRGEDRHTQRMDIGGLRSKADNNDVSAILDDVIGEGEGEIFFQYIGPTT